MRKYNSELLLSKLTHRYSFTLLRSRSLSVSSALSQSLTLSRKNSVWSDSLTFSAISRGSVTGVNEVSGSMLIHHLLINNINNAFFITDNTFYWLPEGLFYYKTYLKSSFLLSTAIIKRKKNHHSIIILMTDHFFPSLKLNHKSHLIKLHGNWMTLIMQKIKTKDAFSQSLTTGNDAIWPMWPILRVSRRLTIILPFGFISRRATVRKTLCLFPLWGRVPPTHVLTNKKGSWGLIWGRFLWRTK